MSLAERIRLQAKNEELGALQSEEDAKAEEIKSLNASLEEEQNKYQVLNEELEKLRKENNALKEENNRLIAMCQRQTTNKGGEKIKEETIIDTAALIEKIALLETKLEKHEKSLAVIQKHAALPEGIVYERMLEVVQQFVQPNMTCYIDYAWEPDQERNKALQVRLLQMKQHLKKVGITVLIDLENMEGDIEEYMRWGIGACHKYLLILTPRLKQRVEDNNSQPNNLQKAVAMAAARQKADPKFIVPLMFEGNFINSVPGCVNSILFLDFLNPAEYWHRMTSLRPTGLIPLLLGLQEYHWYSELLRGYNAQVDEISRQLVV